MKRCVPLEAAAEAVCNQSAIPPLIFQLSPAQGRKVLEEAQNTPVYKYPAKITVKETCTGKWGSIPVYFVMPENSAPIQNVIFYIHGAGWVFGNHDYQRSGRRFTQRRRSFW